MTSTKCSSSAFPGVDARGGLGRDLPEPEPGLPQHHGGQGRVLARVQALLAALLAGTRHHLRAVVMNSSAACSGKSSAASRICASGTVPT
jgi:hypothetical protein